MTGQNAPTKAPKIPPHVANSPVPSHSDTAKPTMPAVRPKSRMNPAFLALGLGARETETWRGFSSRAAKPGIACAGTQVSRSDDTGVRGPILPFCTSSSNSASVTGPIVSFANLMYQRLGSIDRFSGQNAAFKGRAIITFESEQRPIPAAPRRRWERGKAALSLRSHHSADNAGGGRCPLRIAVPPMLVLRGC
jgi:hypothetical protein